MRMVIKIEEETNTCLSLYLILVIKEKLYCKIINKF